MNQAVNDISSFIVSESGAFPSMNELNTRAVANRRAVEREMRRTENMIRSIVHNLLEGKIGKMDALKDIRNILQERVELPELRAVVNDALNEYPDLMVGGKKRGRRTRKQRKTKKSRKNKKGMPRRLTRKAK